ncbi:hypothetical protein MXB_301 [Myxobolus squamalis]|nr:hypothetical protein MXB_301 [Myxobolus squamalis]
MLRLVHMPVHTRVGTLIYRLFQGSVGVKLSKITSYLLPLGMPNFKSIGSRGNGVGLN